MRRGIGVFYKNKFRISIVLICCSTLLIGVRFLSSESESKIDFSNQNKIIHNEIERDPIEYKVIKKKVEPNKDDNLYKQKTNDLNPHLLAQINKFNNVNRPQFESNNINNNVNRFKIERMQPNQQKLDSNPDFLSNLEKIVHLDLKGAPPKIDYIKKFIPFIKKFGATGILLEYEDTFPFEGNLAEARHGNAYSLEDINTIKILAKENGLKIIPLVQTYGHLEWLLKIKKFAHLREVSEFPQVITPCINESYAVIFDMLDQVIKQHSDVTEFHVGCDEVYYKLQHEKCFNFPNKDDFAKAFMSHLVKIANHIRSKIPNVKIIFWDDMMHGMDETSLLMYKKDIDNLQLQPMMWGYMENVETYFQPDLYVKYGNVFGKIWIATAYKGASGELATITSIQHHYLNHISWIDVMKEKISRNVVKFIGVAITGWSRYDHFLTLCDILPQSIPSLIFNLQVMQHGRLTEQKKEEISRQLGCTGQIPWDGNVNYPITCQFPGHEVYEAMLPLQPILANYKADMEFAEKYVSPMNLMYAYLHKKRTSEVLDKLRYLYSSMSNFKDNFIKACDTMYWPDVANEWLLVYFIPQFDDLYNILSRVKNLSSQNDWAPRPLPITLKQYPKDF
ncbi:unnamed protein product [Brachionus calyciflorus]|uniref:beta-N-acetylhexosaminidase n=1 Tax=Brachionus calyciflorus TaxID=104777 RepID=A0A814CJB9_9BILA|nr:unnamed protein product [Brachionus calyciflorus]